MEKIRTSNISYGFNTVAEYRAQVNAYRNPSLTKFPPPKKPRKRTCGCEFPRTFPEIHCSCDRQKAHESEDIPPLDDKDAIRTSKEFAVAALSYLRKQGHDYELVLPGYYGGATVGGGARFHHNFKAKRARDPNAPVETFFSQVFNRIGRNGCFTKDMSIDCCVSLGNSDSLPKRRYNFGCACCSKETIHPKGGCEGMIWGGR